MKRNMMCTKNGSGPERYDVVEKENGSFDVSRQGGGCFVLASYPSRAALLADFTEVKLDLALKKGKVSADFIPGFAEIACYSNGLLWNGFSQPFFDEVNTKRVVDLLTTGLPAGVAPALKWVDGELLELKYPEEEYHVSASKEYLVDGEMVRLWGIGEDGWAWDPVEFSEPVTATTAN